MPPTAGLTALRKIQIGKETTPGTAHAATARLIGKLTMKQTQKAYQPPDLETGRTALLERSEIVGVDADLTYESDCNFEQLMYFLAMGIKGGVTPTGPAGSLYTWTYVPGYTSFDNPDTFTIQYGDTDQAAVDQAQRATYCVAKDLEISFSMDEAAKLKATLFGQQVASAAFTGAISPPAALVSAKGGNSKLYIDTSWAGIGGTNIPATIVNASWKLPTGFKGMKYGDGQLYFSDLAEAKRGVNLDLTLALNSTIFAKYAAYLAQTMQYIRLAITDAAGRELDLDVSGIIDVFDPIASRDGQDIVPIKIKSIFDQTGGKDFQVILKNLIAAIP